MAVGSVCRRGDCLLPVRVADFCFLDGLPSFRWWGIVAHPLWIRCCKIQHASPREFFAAIMVSGRLRRKDATGSAVLSKNHFLDCPSENSIGSLSCLGNGISKLV